MEERAPKKVPVTGVAAEYQKIEQDYRRNVAIVEARPLVERLMLGAWAAFDVVLGVVFAVGVLWYLANGMFVDERRAGELFANAAVTRDWAGARMPDSLVAERPYVVLANAAGTRFDVVAKVEHNAAPWVAEFTYQFTWSGGQSPEYVGFALPGVPFYATALGVEGARPNGAEVQLRDIRWHRLDSRQVSNVDAWLAERSSFPVADDVTSDVVALGSATVSQTSFQLTNATPYTLYDPEFVVMVRRAGAPVAVTVVRVPQFIAASTRLVTVGWLTQLPAPVQIDVFPRIPFHSPDAY